MVFHAATVAKEVFDWASLHFFNRFWFWVATGMDFGFIANQGRGKGPFESKVTQLISNLVVARYYKTACFAPKCMANIKLLEAVIAVQCKASE
jgi:hypothetical protein